MNHVATINPAQTMQALVPRNVPEALQLADTLASSSLIPKHLQGKAGDCLLIVMQAQRWGMDVLSVAQCTSIVSGKLCYEGKLVAAVLYSMGAVDGRLRYEYNHEGQARSITVTGRPSGMDVDQSVTGTVKDWATSNEHWKKSPDDMLAYRGTRQWARRYAPEALLGVYTPDEIEETPESTQARSVHVVRQERAQELPAYSSADFAKNLSSWRDIIDSGKRTADEIIATIESKATLTALQKARIHDPMAKEVIEGEIINEQERAA